MPGPLLLEHLQRGFDLHQGRNQIGFDGRLVGPQLARPQRRALADTGVDDHPVDAAERVGQFREHLRHLLVVVDVQRGDGDLDARILLRKFGFELVEPVGAAGAQRQVTPLGGERAGHAGAQAGAGAGDEDLLPSHRAQHMLLRADATSAGRPAPCRRSGRSGSTETTCRRTTLRGRCRRIPGTASRCGRAPACRIASRPSMSRPAGRPIATRRRSAPTPSRRAARRAAPSVSFPAVANGDSLATCRISSL